VSSTEKQTEVVKPEVGTPGAATEGHIKRLAGSHDPTQESYVDLHEHAKRLERLARWDRAAPLLALALLFFGAAVGAWVADEKLGRNAILCFVAGAALLIGGVLLRDERRRSIGYLHEDMAKRLCLYDEDPRVQAIQERYRKIEQEAFDKTLRGIAVRAVRKYLAHRREQNKTPNDT
jgi:hypothetical protein